MLTIEDYALLKGISEEPMYPISSDHNLMNQAIKLESEGLIRSKLLPFEDAVNWSLTEKGKIVLKEAEEMRMRG